MNGPIDLPQLSTANVITSNNFIRVMFNNVEEGKYYYAYVEDIGPELFIVEVYEKGDDNLVLNIHFSKNEDNVWGEAPYNYNDRTVSFEASDIDGDIKLYKPIENAGGTRRKKTRVTKKRHLKKKIAKHCKTRRVRRYSKRK